LQTEHSAPFLTLQTVHRRRGMLLSEATVTIEAMKVVSCRKFVGSRKLDGIVKENEPNDLGR
jgi:hypothetical protein